VIAELEQWLCAMEAKITMLMQMPPDFGPQVDVPNLQNTKEECAKERELEHQERAAEQSEWEAQGHKLRAMSNIVMHLIGLPNP
jgi:hypothetical protein